MTPEQRERMESLSTKLADVVLQDADPDNWSAAGVRLCEMTKDQRGDAKWCRQTAVQSVALFVRVQQALRDTPPPAGPEAEKSEEAMIREAEAEASKLLERVRR